MVTNQHPIRHMCLTIKLIKAQMQLLLAFEVMEWTQRDFATFFVMSEMGHKTENPTYSQMIGALGSWLRFYRRLIDKLPFGEFRTNIEAEWSKVCMGYEDLLEVKQN